MFQKLDVLWYYDIFPKVVPVGKPVEITVRILSTHVRFTPETAVRVLPVNAGHNVKGREYPTAGDEREIRFTCEFPSEQEYHIFLISDQGEEFAELEIYALEQDLLGLQPLVGDFHAHTYHSDGCESPGFVAARYREEGLDFISITDHFQYRPSIEAQNDFREFDMDFQIYPGEEIHTPDNMVHLVNFGSDRSVNDIYVGWDAPHPEWDAMVKEYQDKLSGLPEEIDPFIHSSCAVAASLVRQYGGMCILAHPHWRASVRNVPDAWTRYWLEHGIVDALEVVGGQSCTENITQIALYHQLRAEGIQVPIVGSSDSHGSTGNRTYGDIPDQYRIFLEERTMVFAPENTKDCIIEAVKGLNSVAIQKYIGQNCQIYGPYRLVQYAMFLLRNYYPLQNELCREEGRLMRCFLGGDQEAAARLQAVGRQTGKLREKYFS